MSELKVNKLSPESGTTLTLGDAGDTIINNGTASGFLPTAGSSGNVLTSDGTNWASTAAAGGGAWTLIGTAVASSSASLTITGLDSTYDTYAIAISDMVPSTNMAYLQMQLGDSSGLDTGSTDYTYHCSNSSNVSTAYDAQSNHGNVWIRLPGGVGSGAGQGIGGILHLNRPGDGTTRPLISGTMTFVDNNNYGKGGHVIGTRTAVIAVDRVGVHFSSGNIASGRMTVWGISHT